jgi:hypothetical protein
MTQRDEPAPASQLEHRHRSGNFYLSEIEFGSNMKESYSLRTHSTFDSEREVAISDEFTAGFKHDLHRGLKSRQIAMAPRPTLSIQGSTD